MPEDLFNMYFFNATTPAYITVFGGDNNEYLFDFSTPGQVGMVDMDGNAIYIDDTGLHFATSNCTFVLDATIDNFAEQLSSYGNSSSGNSSSPLRLRELESLLKRFVETNIAVTVSLYDQCGNNVTDLTPSMELGPTGCSAPASDGEGDFTFTCQFPGENSPEMKCENGINFFVNNIAGGLVGSATNWAVTAGLILQGLKIVLGPSAVYGAIAAAGLAAGETALAALFTFGTIFVWATAALAAIETAVAIYNQFSPNGLAQDICMSFNSGQFPEQLTLSVGGQTYTFDSLSAAPSGPIEASFQIEDPNVPSNCSTCSWPIKRQEPDCFIWGCGACGENGNPMREFIPCNYNSEHCFCSYTAENYLTCFYNEYCPYLDMCQSSRDCEEGFKCLIDACCNYPVCTDTRPCQQDSSSKARDVQHLGRGLRANVSAGPLPPDTPMAFGIVRRDYDID